MPKLIYKCDLCGRKFEGENAESKAEMCEAQGEPPFKYVKGQELPAFPHKPVFRIIETFVSRQWQGKHIPRYTVLYLRRGQTRNMTETHITSTVDRFVRLEKGEQEKSA